MKRGITLIVSLAFLLAGMMPFVQDAERTPAAYGEKASEDSAISSVAADLVMEYAGERKDALHTPHEFNMKNAVAGDYAQRVIRYYEKDNDEVFSKHYAGVWINRDDVLTVGLSCPDDSCGCKRKIIEGLGCEEVSFVVSQGSYKESSEAIYAVSWSLVAFYNDRLLHGKGTDGDLLLQPVQPSYVYDYETNRVLVTFMVSDEMHENVKMIQEALSEAIVPEWYLWTTFSEEAKEDYRQFKEYVELFKQCICDMDCVEYITRNYSIEAGEGAECASWHPGEKIYRYYNGSYQYFSTGFRALWSEYDEFGSLLGYYPGYVTAAHAVSLGDLIYIKTSSGSYVNVGTVADRIYGGYLDTAFISKTNTSYTFSSDLCYTEYGNPYYDSNNPVSMTSGYVTPVVGYSIYKSGATTGLTEDVIVDINHSETYYGVYFTGLIESEAIMSQGGDSGGIAYYVDPSGNVGTLGHVRGSVTFISAKYCTLYTPISAIY